MLFSIELQKRSIMDRYMKIVFTVIAISLTVIAINQVVSPGIAFGYNCGYYNVPCYVTIR